MRSGVALKLRDRPEGSAAHALAGVAAALALYSLVYAIQADGADGADRLKCSVRTTTETTQPAIVAPSAAPEATNKVLAPATKTTVVQDCSAVPLWKSPVAVALGLAFAFAVPALLRALPENSEATGPGGVGIKRGSVTPPSLTAVSKSEEAEYEVLQAASGGDDPGKPPTKSTQRPL